MSENESFPETVDKFSGRFHKEAVAQHDGENIISSPLSADVVMAMVALGARGQTKDEITHSLSIKNLDEISPSLKSFVEDVNNVKHVTLSLANKIYVKPSSTGKLDSVTPLYRSRVQDIFKSDVEQVNFVNNVETAAQINNWVENKTNHRIKDIISKDSLDATTAAVLVNAIYFKGAWSKKFDKELTKKEKFTQADGKDVDVDMMNLNAEFWYSESEELQAKIVSLPYENFAISLVIILPNDKNGLANVETKLASGINQYLKKSYKANVFLKLPKFSINTELDIGDILFKLGTKRVFTPLAELGEILNEESGLYVSKAVQKAFFEVNEEGAEAAAASVVHMVTYSLLVGPSPPDKYFYADHPFFFAIQYQGTTLFTGSFKKGQ